STDAMSTDATSTGTTSTGTMSISAARIGAIIRKELREFRRNRFILVTASILPLVFLISPTAQILAIKASAVTTAVLHAPQLLAALVFIPLLAAWAIWAGLAISARSSDTRVAQQLSILA